MSVFRVLIVEDDPFIAMGLEDDLLAAGWEVCGVAGSEAEALRMGAATRPSFAVVDVRLSPGDGRVVARELVRRYGTTVLMATAQTEAAENLAATGALACLPKPYATRHVPAALEAIADLREGRPVFQLPANMFRLRPVAPVPPTYSSHQRRVRRWRDRLAVPAGRPGRTPDRSAGHPG